MHWLIEIGRALQMAAVMGWQMLWALILGFGLSAVVQATVSREKVAKLMPDGSPRSIAIASGLGAASSSCSYAAVALARTLFRKGADFRAAMAFEFASTNLVFELGLSLIVLLGWRFAAAEFVGGPVMIVLLVVLLNAFFSKRLVDEARKQAERGLLGRMEGHAAMDMAAQGDTWWARLRSPGVFMAISNIFVMEWAAVLGDIVLGLVLSGCIAAWVPTAFWQRFFLVGHPALAHWWGPFAGPLVALVSFVCSVGNVPLAAVLWQHWAELRRRDRLSVRRSDHPAHREHSSQVLWLARGAGVAGAVLCGDGGRGTRRGVDIFCAASHAARARSRDGDGDGLSLGPYGCVEYRLPCDCSGAAVAIPPLRRCGYAAAYERTDGGRSWHAPCGPRRTT
jgi:uncharacterized membrane protein YraQ (UPF0718 family)